MGFCSKLMIIDPVPIHPVVQADPGLDYECELVAIIGKEARDVSEDAALQYVLGYTVGNDVSHREWQLKKGGGQWFGAYRQR